MSGSVAIVFGGASGIGAATARLLAARGDVVMVADREAGAAERLAGELGPEHGFVACDVTEEAAVEAAVGAAVARFGGLHLALNAAGVPGTPAKVARCDADGWRRTIEVNLTGTFLCLKHELPAIRAAGGGAVVNVASSAGLMAVPGLADYCASKWGVIGLTRSTALEVARAGVRVNVLCPGTTLTPMLEGFAGGREQAEAMGSMTPIGRIGSPEEVAEAAVFLLSDAASYLTGAVVPVDGGASAT